jgi:hypothetical protein
VNEDIGCYPPTWPRPPKHPVPEPEPDSLDEQVDWMTYSHPELYAMVHTGLDLTGAMAVSATWARLGEELSDIGDELARLLAATTQAWEGESAELARESVSALSDWSRDTGTRATEVSGCVTIQVDNATTARNAMPKPPYPVGPKAEPGVTPLDTAFVSGGLASAAPLVADPAKYSKRERALHHQAASTMQQFQDSSRDVYATVPQFVPPNLRRTPFGGTTEPTPQPPPRPRPQPQPLPSVPASAPVTGGAPVASGGPGPAERTSSPRPGGKPGAGGGAGVVEREPVRPAAAASSSAAARPGGGGTGMGMPMGGAHGGQGGEDKERRSRRYLEEDDDIWGLDEKAMPPVIGEVNRRA